MNDDDRCPGTNRQGERCGHPAGWGTDNESGPCKFHGGAGGSGGAREGSGAPERNTNAVRHGAYADHNHFYQDILDEPLRELVDVIHGDYLDDYTEQHGSPPLGIEMELFRIAITHVKDIVLDNWGQDRPESLESGNALVDQETHYSESGRKYHRYKESVVLTAQKRLASDRRQWLKDLGLLEDPDSQKAEAAEGIISILSSEANDTDEH